jgi:hypothetical protein
VRRKISIGKLLFEINYGIKFFYPLAILLAKNLSVLIACSIKICYLDAYSIKIYYLDVEEKNLRGGKIESVKEKCG